MVIEVQGGKVMRMPLHAGDDIDEFINMRMQDFMKAYIGMQNELKAAGISVIEVDYKLSQPPFAIFVEKKVFLFKGDQFFEMLRIGPIRPLKQLIKNGGEWEISA